jgi:hypothetical protein
MSSTGEGAVAARSEIREIIARKGHAVDLSVALEQDDGQKLGGKSAEASRFILRAIDRELDEA